MSPTSPATLARARVLARTRRRTVFITGDSVTESRPKNTDFLAVWPSGAMTLGIPSGQVRVDHD